MINYKKLYDLNLESAEGQLLMSALAILTSLDKEHIKSGEYGECSHPDNVLGKVVDLANKLYYKEEYEKYLISENRNNKINGIIDGI